MQWLRIFKRKRWLFIIPTILWQIIWEFTKDTIIEATRDYFVGQGSATRILDYLLQHPIIIVGIVAIAVFIWAYIDTRKEHEAENNLKVKVRRCNILDYYPQPSNLIANVFGHYNIIEVETEFHPEGDIRLHSIELHTGRHTFGTKNLPVITVDRDAVYPIPFEVPSKIIEYQRTSTDNYLRVLFNDRDCRSDNFSFNMVYEANGKRYLIR